MKIKEGGQPKTFLGIIPARGGSKRYPGKNIALFRGKPMIAWSIEAGLQAPSIDRLILTSDDAAIIEVAQNHGCEVPFVRPAELAQDNTSSLDATLHVLDFLLDEEGAEYDYLVLLQPPSPLRTAKDIEAAIKLCLQKSPEVGCVSAAHPPLNPVHLFPVDSNDVVVDADSPDKVDEVSLNGAIYVCNTKTFRDTKKFLQSGSAIYKMPPERSYDIDYKEEAATAET